VKGGKKLVMRNRSSGIKLADGNCERLASLRMSNLAAGEHQTKKQQEDSVGTTLHALFIA
jgi:hypothetical protein